MTTQKRKTPPKDEGGKRGFKNKRGLTEKPGLSREKREELKREIFFTIVLGNTEKALSLISDLDIDERLRFDFTPLMLASRENNLALVRAFIDHGADVNARTEDDTTALELAVRNGYEHLVMILRTAGVEGYDEEMERRLDEAVREKKERGYTTRKTGSL